MDSSCILATLDSAHPDERVQVVLQRSPEGGSAVSLIQQSWSESLGWYTQKAMDLSPEQVRQLRAALGVQTASKLTNHSPGPLAIGHPACVPFRAPGRRAHSA